MNEKEKLNDDFMKYIKENKIELLFNSRKNKFDISKDEYGNFSGFKGRMNFNFNFFKSCYKRFFNYNTIYELGTVTKENIVLIKKFLDKEISFNKLKDIKEIYEIKESYFSEMVEEEKNINKIINECFHSRKKVPEFEMENVIDYIKTILSKENIQLIKKGSQHFLAFKFERLFDKMIEHLIKYEDCLNTNFMKTMYYLVDKYKRLCRYYSLIILEYLNEYTNTKLYRQGNMFAIDDAIIYNTNISNFEIAFSCKTIGGYTVLYYNEEYYFKNFDNTQYDYNTKMVTGFQKIKTIYKKN